MKPSAFADSTVQHGIEQQSKITSFFLSSSSPLLFTESGEGIAREQACTGDKIESERI